MAQETERLTEVESPNQVHARMLRIAADMVEGGEYEAVLEMCEQVIKEVKTQLPHWE